MASALLGKVCIGLLALVVLLYTCCYGFRIRDGGPQPPSLDHRTCDGKVCPETVSPTSKRWHEAVLPRLATTRKPPVEPSSSSSLLDEKGVQTEGTRSRFEKGESSWRDRFFTSKDKIGEKGLEEEEDDEDTVEILAEEDDSLEEDDETEEDRSGGDMKLKGTEISDEEEDEDDEDDEDDEEEETIDEIIKKDSKRSVDGRDDRRRPMKILKSMKRIEESEEEEKDDSEVERKIIPKKEEPKGAERETKDTDERKGKDSKVEPASTPPPRKLEKVKYADKDKARSTEAAASISVEKRSVETKKPNETAKRDESAGKPTKPSEVSKRKDAAKPEASLKSKDRTKEVKEEKSKEKKVEVKSTGKSKPLEKKEEKSKERKRTEASITLAELNDAILHVSTFVPNFTVVVDPECRQHGKIFLRQLRGYKLWALQMLDSNAKLPSSLLRGNINQYGDYDECLGAMAHVKVDGKTVKIQGKYCLATVDIHASHPDMKLPVNLMQGRAPIRGTLRDPGHFIPKTNLVHWAICLPAACSAEDAENTLEHALSHYNATSGIRFTVDVDPNTCYVKQKSRSYSKETIGVLYFYAMIVCLVLIATTRDYMITWEGKGTYSERIIMSFSLRRTLNQLFKRVTSETDVTCIHGLRSLTMIIVYIAHELVVLGMSQYTNRVSFSELSTNPITTIIRGGSIYTDSFLLISGALTAYHMSHELSKRGEIRWFCRLIGRIMRLTPPLVVVVFWYAFVMEHVGSGPRWDIIASNADLCKKNAWMNILYIQNFIPFEEICATHTYQIALDMQLSLLVSPLVFFLSYKPLIGIIIIFFCILLSSTLRYIAMTGNNLSLFIYHGISVRQLYKTANLTYIKPLHRTPAYTLGIALGVLLNYTGKNVKIPKIMVIFGWLVAIALGLWTLFSPWRMARRDYVYDVEEVTYHGIVAPIAWSLSMCWMVFACFTNHGGFVNRFLCGHWLIVLSRISYAVYLTQFSVFFYNLGTTRYLTEFQVHHPFLSMQMLIVVAVSTILTLFVDLPMQDVKNVMMEITDNPPDKVPSKQETSAEDKKNNSATKKERLKAFEDDKGGPRRDAGDTEDEDAPVDVPIRKSDERRRSFVARDKYETELSIRDRFNKRFSDEEEYMERGRRSRNSQRSYIHDDSDEDIIELLRAQQQREDFRRERRSYSRGDSKRSFSREPEPEEYSRRRDIEERERQFRRSESRARSSTRDPEDLHSWEFVNRERSGSKDTPDVRRSHRAPSEDYDKKHEPRRIISSGSEDESMQRKSKKHSNVEPRVSDEEDWEHELRIRRKQFMEKIASQKPEGEEEETVEHDLQRRSSAEGRIALLKEPSGDDNMDSWTVSVDPRISQLGSSQEPSEPEEDSGFLLRREYREQAPPSREDTQSEEESSWEGGKQSEEEVSYNFVLTKDSKRISVQDLSKLEEDNGSDSWKKDQDNSSKSTSLGLFKRESIIKSQASEEDPEYLLPERPKLVEQEREHPFKKAWQMQKSRSEEDGSSAYAIKDVKEADKRKSESGGQKSDDAEFLADDEGESTVWQNRSTDTEETKTSSRSTDEMETASSRGGSRSIDERTESEESSSRFSYPEEENRSYETRRKSEETEWNWEQEET